MRIKLWIWGGLLCLTAIAVVAGFRARRLYTVARDWKSEVRYLIESGGTVGALRRSPVNTWTPSSAMTPNCSAT